MEHLVKIHNDFIHKALSVLERENIPFKIAGFPNGKVEVIEKYESKINVHQDMEIYAKKQGYKNISDAIDGMNGARNFKAKYNKYVLENNEI